MVTIEQKLAEFQRIIDDKVERENQQLLAAKKAEIDGFLAKIEQETKDQFSKNQKLAMDRIDRQKQEKISTLIQGERREQLKLMENFLIKLTKKVQDKCKAYVLSDNYSELIQTMFTNTLAKERVVDDQVIKIQLAPQNFETAQKVLENILKEKGFTQYAIEEGDIDYLGGFVLELSDKGIRVDKTLAESIEEKKDDIGQYLQSYIHGGGQ